MSRKVIWAAIVILAIAIAFVLFVPETQKDRKETKKAVDTSGWQTFQSEDFGFQVKYPDGWKKLSAPQDQISPKFNFYAPDEDKEVSEPLTHHSTGFTHVSVFPEGIPTEGLFGETEDLSGDWGSNVDKENSEIYVLEDGTPFAGYIKFKNTPESWGQAGFAWVRLKVDDYGTKCFENGELREDSCDPLGNPDIRIVHTGEVDSSVWPKLRAAVRSLSFNN